MTAKGLFQKPAVNTRVRSSGNIYRITIYWQHGGGDYHGRIPRAGGAALPPSQVRRRRGRDGTGRGPRAAAVPASARASRAPGGPGSDDSHTGTPPAAEPSQHRGAHTTH